MNIIRYKILPTMCAIITAAFFPLSFYTYAGGNPLENNPLLENVANTVGYNRAIDPNYIVIDIVGQVVFTLVSFLGIFFICLIIYAGFIWMNARGNDSDVDRAKGTIRNAVIGLLITTASYSIWLLIDYILFGPPGGI